MSVHWPILRTLVRSPGRTLFVDDRRSWRAIDLLVVASHVASEIERRCTSDTVGVLVPTSGAFPAVTLACWMLGKIPVPLNYLLAEGELQYIVDHCGTDTIVASGALMDGLDLHPRAGSTITLEDVDFRSVPDLRWPALIPDEQLATILYTSGTSGRPKGVMLTHGNIASNIRQVVTWAGFTRDDVVLGVVPPFHSFGFTVLSMLPASVGCRGICLARFSPARLLTTIRDHRPTAIVAIPSMYGALLRLKDAVPDDFSSLRFIVSGGEPLPDAVASGFRERFGVTINEGYGLTETSPVTHWCRPEDHRAHSVGMPIPGVRQRIVDPATGKDLGPDEDGEVRLDGPNIMAGYYKDPEQTAAVFDERGYFKTGDMGRTDPDGHLYITGRIKEMLIVGGENVFPREIEEVLDRFPPIAKSGVVGLPDPVRGETPIAFLELCEGEPYDEAELIRHCREELPGFKIPRRFVVLDELPRSPTGKVLRRALSQRPEVTGDGGDP